MRLLSTSTRAVAAALLLGLVASSAQAASCKNFAGWGTGVTEGIARFMSEAAMKNAAKAWGGDGVKIAKGKQVCQWETISFGCTSTAKACK